VVSFKWTYREKSVSLVSKQ